MKIVALGLLVALCISCRRERNEGSVREAVLSVGQTVEAINKNGKVRISYLSPLRRKYEWDTEHRTVGLKPRRERFDGKLGIYDPADAWIFNLRKIRLVLGEATRNFDSDERARAALVESSVYMEWVYTPDGFVVGFGGAPSRHEININVFQYLIRVHTPTYWPGSRPDHIALAKLKCV